MKLFRRNRNLFRDYARERRRKRMTLGLLVLGGCVGLFLLALDLTSSRQTEVATVESLHETGAEAGATELSMEVVPAAVDDGLSLVERPLSEAESAQDVTEGVIKSGDTAAALLSEFMSPAEIHDLNRKSAEVYSLSRMRAGQPYRMVSTGGILERFEYEIDSEAMLIVSRDESGYTVQKQEIAYETEMHTVYGKITSSLFGAVAEAGETAALGVRLADIFAWDIDFIRDIRTGDSFAALVEKRSRDGEFAGYGKVLAAQFVNQGETFQGFLYADKSGNEQFFDEQGRSLRKAFLKAPLNFSRISSGFNLKRLHPVLGYRRPHPAIDYAAPKGTPVKTVGDGLVVGRGWDKGGGNYIKIRHNSVYETVYMHLKGFAKGLKKGLRVRQGQVIGYVGSTGMSTGPHLDFRMKKNGSYVNPSRIKSPPCEPVTGDRMAEYLRVIQPLMAQLHGAGLMRAEVQEPGDVAAVDVALQEQ